MTTQHAPLTSARRVATEHHVETWLNDHGVFGWECFTCGAEDSGFGNFTLAEDAADRHCEATRPGTWTEQVNRPDGTVYRARRRPEVEEFSTAEDLCGGFMVTRTHDVDVAAALVARPWNGIFDQPVPAPVARWVRLVPWNDYGTADRSWVDATPDERGAIPVGGFRAEDIW